jgi:hypothetical protein
MSNRAYLVGLPAAWILAVGCFLPEEDRSPRSIPAEGGPDLIARDATIDASDGRWDARDAATDPVDLPENGPMDAATADVASDFPADVGSERPVDAAAHRPDLAIDQPTSDVQPTVPDDVAAPACGARELAITLAVPGCQNELPDDAGVNRCPNVTCARNADGTLLMKYTISSANAWASCELSANENLAAFDVAYEGTGIIEVIFCIESPPGDAHALNLWYGRHPLEKMLALARPGATQPGQCYARYFSPQQSRFPGWTVPTSCKQCSDAGNGGEGICEGRCGPGLDSCPEQFRMAIDSHVAGVDGGAPGSDYDLRKTRLRLTAEWGAGSGTVRLRSIKHLTGFCLCDEDSVCRTGDRLKCWRAQPLDCGPWPLGRGGVCGPRELGCTGPPGEETECTVTSAGKTCMSKIECVDGKYVCPATCP